MTSKQVLLTLAVLMIGGCSLRPERGADPLVSPYGERRLWAIAPFRNESGSQFADGVQIAEHFARQLEEASDLDILPIDRSLRAMDSLQMGQITSQQEAMHLLRVLNVDGLVVGSISAFDPYDPPKLGLVVELYTSPRLERELDDLDVRRLSRASTDEQSLPRHETRRQPMTVISAILDASDPGVRSQLQRYAHERGGEEKNPNSWIRYRISMDLYSEFASYVMSWRLLNAERQRLNPHVPETQSETQSAP